MKSWKTPEDYIEEYIQWHCSSDTREAVGSSARRKQRYNLKKNIVH